MFDGLPSCNGCTIPTILAGFKLTTVKGCYAEFGVFRGGSFAAALDFISKDDQGIITECFGFDSFEGFPPPVAECEMIYTKGKMNETSYEDVYNRLRLLDTGVSFHLIKGYFSDSFASFGPLPPISVCLVDCDSYTPTKQVLEYITPSMRDGSVIIFDDYHLDDGCQKQALEELIASGQILEFVTEVVSPDWKVPIYIWRK
jgi:O-methyltransferase